MHFRKAVREARDMHSLFTDLLPAKNAVIGTAAGGGVSSFVLAVRLRRIVVSVPHACIMY